MADETAGTVDPALFRRVMSSFATGVTVVTTERDGEVRGMTANAFMSGSLTPPLCIVSVATRARTHALLMETGAFGVSILGQGQEKLSIHFSGRPFPDLEPVFERLGGVPVLPGSAGAIAAEIVARHDCGDHSLFVGGITHMRAGITAPLLVHSGRYAALLYSDEELAAPTFDFW